MDNAVVKMDNTVITPFEIGAEFFNRRRERIIVSKRFLTPDNTIEYLVVCGTNEGRITHEKMVNRINSKEWVKE